MERKCIKCVHFPCTKTNCEAENTEVCDLYETEVSRAIKKLREEGYYDFERSEIGGNKMDGNDNGYIKNREKEEQIKKNMLEYQRKFFKKKVR